MPFNVRYPGECDGQSGYGVTKLDCLVDKIVDMQFKRIRNAPPLDLIERQNAKEIELARDKAKLAQDQLRQKQEKYETLRAETVKVSQGKSRLNVDLLKSLVVETEEAVKLLSEQVRTAQEEIQKRIASAEIVRQEYVQLIGWADMYDNCTFEAKKMIIAGFAKAIHVFRDLYLAEETQIEEVV